MRQLLLLLLLAVSGHMFAQQKNSWQLSLQLQPELTFHSASYHAMPNEKLDKTTLNIGVSSLVQYNITNRLFIEGGIGYTARKLKAGVFINQFVLPAPYKDSTDILFVAKSEIMRTLQLPLGVGIYVIKTNKACAFIKGNFVPLFLLSSEYGNSRFPTFKKNTWQGYAITAGAGIDYRITNRLLLTGGLSYSLVNHVKADPYLDGRDGAPVILNYRFLQLSAGIKIKM